MFGKEAFKAPPPPPSTSFANMSAKLFKQESKEEKEAAKKKAEEERKAKEAAAKEAKEQKERIQKLEKQVRELEKRAEKADEEVEKYKERFSWSQGKLARLHAAALMAMGSLKAVPSEHVGDISFVLETLHKALYPSNPLPVEVEPYAKPIDSYEVAGTVA